MRTCYMIAICLFLTSSVFAQQGQNDQIRHGSFDRIVSMLKDDASKTVTRVGSDGVKVTCTVMPHGEITGVAWEIYNPKKKALDIGSGDIKLSDQVRELAPLSPQKAAGVLFGTSYEKPVADPFIDAAAPAAYTAPAIASAAQGTQDIYSSSVNFGKTDSVRIMGIAFYSRYGAGEKYTASMKLGNETLEFEF